MASFFSIILATFIISLGALIGICTLALKQERLSRLLLFLVSLSAGSFIGGAFLHLLPEAGEKLPGDKMYLVVLGSFIFFFFVEKILHWRHCHQGMCAVHTFGWMNLFGDAVHNFIDGLIIAAAFLTDSKLGVVTTLAVALHEIPQEISDFGVLLYAGFTKYKALLANFLVALTVIAGGAAGYFLSFRIESLIPYLLPFAAGGFIYIAASDLMPGIRKEPSLKKSLASFGVFIAGVALMWALKLTGHE